MLHLDTGAPGSCSLVLKLVMLMDPGRRLLLTGGLVGRKKRTRHHDPELSSPMRAGTTVIWFLLWLLTCASATTGTASSAIPLRAPAATSPSHSPRSTPAFRCSFTLALSNDVSAIITPR